MRGNNHRSRIGITRGVNFGGIGADRKGEVQPQTAACSAGLFRVSRQPEGTPSASRAAWREKSANEPGRKKDMFTSVRLMAIAVQKCL